ncbi:uncharacterized membrane protein YidH (DUF202 family) [Algoriphagus sp. 4150]|uniref:DUF3995 domain-containing protein n=1 Tax=Algoriphagus sp. 4150 TaxID=2817756 RepID=UPI002855F0FA|nr:DUF3995 domain-containing protein [Algoriphagus sp. 4150]MDR7132590.1 uncharacterized membrane protein YidH (DUF202 family) [Algoriphagus sp. 4150]
MKSTLPILLIISFSGLALIHFYWASGGQRGFESALPTNEQGIRMLNPQTIDSIIIGVALSLFGLFYWSTFISAKGKFPYWIKIIGLWIIPIIFALRALGDFKYIGFFKQIKSTEFAKLDTLFYSPLCLFIALIGFVLLSKK